MEKVIFIDVDGTLRNDERKITQRTLDAINKVKSIGYECVICTGRPRDYIEKLNDEIKISRYIILSNGAEIFDCRKKKVIYQNPLAKESILNLYKVSNHKDVRFILNCLGTRYVNRVKDSELETLMDEPIESFVKKNKIIQVTIASSDFNIIKDMKNAISEIPNTEIINQSKSLINTSFTPIGTIYYDVVDTHSSKGTAINRFCKIFNIPYENRIAIGDNNNDLSMFNECGYTVAMANSLPSVLEIADYITDDNNNDGVAKYLEKLYFDYIKIPNESTEKVL